MNEDIGRIIAVEEKDIPHGPVELHFFIVINPNTAHGVFWFVTHTVKREKIFTTCKEIVKEKGDELFIFDGILYQYDHGCGRFIRQRWENVCYDYDL